MSSSDSHWHPAYFTTRFRVERAEPWLMSDFAIITACATTGEVWPPEREAAADAALREALVAEGVLCGRVVGYDPSTGHAEPGWAATMSTEHALRVGRAFAQDAVFVVKDGTVWLHCCDGRRRSEPVGPLAERLTVTAARADVDASMSNDRWQQLIDALVMLAASGGIAHPPALVDLRAVSHELLRNGTGWDQLAKEATAPELAAVIRGIVWFSRIGGHTGGSVSPVIRLFAAFRARFSREETDALSRWIVAHRTNEYEPYGSAMYGAYDTVDAYETAQAERHARSARNSAREQLRQHEASALRKALDADDATARLRGAVQRGDLAAVEALLARGASWQRVVAESGSLQALAREHGRDTMLQLLQCRAIP